MKLSKNSVFFGFEKTGGDVRAWDEKQVKKRPKKTPNLHTFSHQGGRGMIGKLSKNLKFLKTGFPVSYGFLAGRPEKPPKKHENFGLGRGRFLAKNAKIGVTF